MLQRLIQALIESENEAADDMLVEALGIGNASEKAVVLDALIRREGVRGLSGVIDLFPTLPDELKLEVLRNIRYFHAALRECGKSDHTRRRLGAMKLIAQGRVGRLSYVLSENLHSNDEQLSRAAVEAIVALARWIASESRNLQKLADDERKRVYREMMDNRAEVEQTVARAMDVHRGKHGPELLRAAMLLCDWPGSRTLAILQTTKHAGQSPMVRRMQQKPASEHVEAFLLGASHAGLRTQFGIAFSHIDEVPVLDALMRKTHWLKDHQLQLCMHQVTRGVWWGDPELARDIDRRDAGDAARVGEWLAVSGLHDVMQDEKLIAIYGKVKDDLGAKLRLLRIAARRPRGASVQLFKKLLEDGDERIVRMAAREIARRRPMDFENVLLQLMISAADSVRRVVSRSIGQVGFENFWQRFDRLDKPTRRNAGKAMLKLLPDAVVRLGKRLVSGPVSQRLKAMQIAHELELAGELRGHLVRLCTDGNPRLRSKAVHVLGALPTLPSEVLLDRVLSDQDARVRANAIEVLESKRKTDYIPMLTARARSKQAHNRERANAIKALARMHVGTASTQLLYMLQDERPEHRISAMWALKAIGVWQLLHQVGNIAKADGDMKVRRYALTVLRGVAEMVAEHKKRKAG